MELERRDLLRYGSISAIMTASGCLGLIGSDDESPSDGSSDGSSDSGDSSGDGETDQEDTVETGPPEAILRKRVAALTEFLDFASGPARGARSAYVQLLTEAGDMLTQVEQADPSSVDVEDIEPIGEKLAAAEKEREPLEEYYSTHYPVAETGEEFVSEATAAIEREDYNSLENVLFDYKSIVAALQESSTIGAREYYPLSVVHRDPYELLLNTSPGNIELEGSTDVSYDRIGEVYHRGAQGQFSGYLTPVNLPLNAEPFNEDTYNSFDEEQTYEYEGDIESELTVDAGDDDDEDDELENPVYPFVYTDVFGVEDGRISETLLEVIHCNFVDWGDPSYPDGFLEEDDDDDDDEPANVTPDRDTPMNVDGVGREQQSLAYIQRFESAAIAATAFETLQEAVGVGEDVSQWGGFEWTRLYATESEADETLYADAVQTGPFIVLTELRPTSRREREAADETSDGDENDPDDDNENEYPATRLLTGTLFDLTNLGDSEESGSGD